MKWSTEERAEFQRIRDLLDEARARQARLHAEGDLYDPILEEAHVAYPRHVEPAETSPAVLSAIAAMPAAVPPRQKRRRRRQAEEVPEKLARLLF